MPPAKFLLLLSKTHSARVALAGFHLLSKWDKAMLWVVLQVTLTCFWKSPSASDCISLKGRKDPKSRLTNTMSSSALVQLCSPASSADLSRQDTHLLKQRYRKRTPGKASASSLRVSVLPQPANAEILQSMGHAMLR